MGQENNGFRTIRGYELIEKNNHLTASMEDYLEMIYRLSGPKGYTRISDIAAALHVQPPSASHMIQKLADMSYVEYEKYGAVTLSQQGWEVGAYLLERHHIIEEFLKIIGVTENVLVETEKIEHNLSPSTVLCLARLASWLQDNPAWSLHDKAGE
ncbi:MAG: metal-dependent transcriptional regulator [Syntrophomonadaceae bacterium]